MDDKIKEVQSGGSKFKEKMLKTIEGYKNLSDEQKNCIHIYFGYGKGKTTAAMGLAVRALGAGKKVAIVQFDKGYDGMNEHYSERNIFRKLAEIGYAVKLFPSGCERMNEDGTFRFGNTDEDIAEGKRALVVVHDLIKNGDQDLLVVDELIAAATYNLISREDVEEVMKLFKNNKRFELVLTGHKIWAEIEEMADLITEMKKVKHYFDNGIPAREGIEF